MLSKEQQQSLGEESVAVIRKYEQELLNLMAEQLAKIDVTDPAQTLAAQAVVTIKSRALARKYRKKLLKAAKRELDAAFWLNEEQELTRLSKAVSDA